MKKVAISIGDLNGIGIQIALQCHSQISKIVEPIYCIDKEMLKQASYRLNIAIANDFKCVEDIAPYFEIEPAKVSKNSGIYSYNSFLKAIKLADSRNVDAICTLPIHKKAWELADVNYKGHTDMLRDYFNAKAIMMLGCKEMFIALYTEHIPLKDVASSLNEKDLTRFFIDFYNKAKPTQTVAVLGLNPHAGDNGVLGDEESIISTAINNATKIIDKLNPSTFKPIFTAPLVPDVAFTPNIRKKYSHYIAMYHDQGLAPLKALYFDEGINVSLNLPILRTSVDHGTAFDVAYSGYNLNLLSYINAIQYIKDTYEK